jgi:hypothetical protein
MGKRIKLRISLTSGASSSQRANKMTRRSSLTLIVLLAGALLVAAPVRADVAPPNQPPGSSISPGGQTQVRMVSERVVLTVQGLPTGDQRPQLAGDAARAQVRADFQMRNLGQVDERMQVRFPLQDPSGESSGFSKYPEVQGFSALIDGRPVATTVITSTNPQGGDAPPVRWAAFDVTFPVGRDVPIGVAYTIAPTGYFPAARFAYVLETGAGWRDTIGSTDLIVQLPYTASKEFVLPGLPNSGEDAPTAAGASFVGKEIRWHRENLEPTAQDNFFVTLIVPRVWQGILDARTAAAAQPNAAAVIVRLALAYESAVTSRFPTDDGDPFAALSEQTYAQAIVLEPGSAALHAEFARLIWDHLTVEAALPAGDPNVQRVLGEVAATLALDPQNAQAQALFAEMQASVEGVLALPTPTTAVVTAAPTAAPITPTAPPTARPSLSVAPSLTIALTATLAPTPTSTPAPAGGSSLPLLIGVLAVVLAIVLFVLARRWRQR